jgi:hypothetical protein
MPDGVTIIYKLDEPSMGESSFKGRLPPLGGSPVTMTSQDQGMPDSEWTHRVTPSCRRAGTEAEWIFDGIIP